MLADVPRPLNAPLAVRLAAVRHLVPAEVLLHHDDGAGPLVVGAAERERGDHVHALPRDVATGEAEGERLHRLPAPARLHPEPLPLARRVHGSLLLATRGTDHRGSPASYAAAIVPG